MTAWCILRTSPSQTIALAVALKEAGIEAWTPTETVKPEPKRIESWEKVRPRRRKGPTFVTRPLIPTFVFADANRMGELTRMAHATALTYQVWDKTLGRMITKGRPFFRLFEADRRPIPDKALAPLRRIEGRRRKPRGDLPAFKSGDPVRLTEGAYEGLRGVIVSVTGKKAKVAFPGSNFDVEIFTWLLIPDLDGALGIHQSGGEAERRGKAA